MSAPAQPVEDWRAAVAVRLIRVVEAQLREDARRDAGHERSCGETHEPARLHEVAEDAAESLARRCIAVPRRLRKRPGLLGVDRAVRAADEFPERRERFVESPLCHPSTTLRRSALEEVGGYEDGDLPEDYQLWLKLIDAGWKLACVPELLFRWRDHRDRLTRADPRYAEERFIATKARYLARGPLARARVCAVWGAGRTGLALVRKLRQEGVAVVQLLEVNPSKIGTRIEGIPVAPWTALGPPGETHLLVAVGAKGAREEIRAVLASRGWIEERDFTCCA